MHVQSNINPIGMKSDIIRTRHFPNYTYVVWDSLSPTLTVLHKYTSSILFEGDAPRVLKHSEKKTTNVLVQDEN